MARAQRTKADEDRFEAQRVRARDLHLARRWLEASHKLFAAVSALQSEVGLELVDYPGGMRRAIVRRHPDPDALSDAWVALARAIEDATDIDCALRERFAQDVATELRPLEER